MKMIFSDSRGSFWKIIHGQFSPIGAMTTLQLFENHISSAKAMIARKRQEKQLSDCDKFEAPFFGEQSFLRFAFRFSGLHRLLTTYKFHPPHPICWGKSLWKSKNKWEAGKNPNAFRDLAVSFALCKIRFEREGNRDNQTFFERYARATFCRQLDKEGSKSREPERSDAVPYRLRTAPCFHSRSTFISNLAPLWNARSLEPFSRPGWHKRA